MSTTTALPNLTALREQQGISLGQIANTTKIGVHYLEGIEHGEFKRLPGGVYNTSYIRQYARAIGFSEEALLDAYLKLTPACCGRD
ncbi:MAG TPA: helix-turn-helix transcriptional regulator [Candidatus Solibacter sp.]|jgi:cytoskeletal protein RodZ|nr:helix-turn-helix transcriptional regulator [Candidatus Solibacter sp.]